MNAIDTEPRLLKVLTKDRDVHQAACNALAGVGMTHDGEHSCGIYVRTDDPDLAAKALLGVDGVYAVWFANSAHGGRVTV